MTAGIGVAQWVVVNIRIPVQRLRVPGLGHDGIRLQEAAQRGVIKARPVVIQAEGRLPPLAGEAAVGGEELTLQANRPIRQISRCPRDTPPCASTVTLPRWSPTAASTVLPSRTATTSPPNRYSFRATPPRTSSPSSTTPVRRPPTSRTAQFPSASYLKGGDLLHILPHRYSID
jgi:hypothetical protein